MALTANTWILLWSCDQSSMFMIVLIYTCIITYLLCAYFIVFRCMNNCLNSKIIGWCKDLKKMMQWQKQWWQHLILFESIVANYLTGFNLTKGEALPGSHGASQIEDQVSTQDSRPKSWKPQPPPKVKATTRNESSSWPILLFPHFANRKIWWIFSPQKKLGAKKTSSPERVELQMCWVSGFLCELSRCSAKIWNTCEAETKLWCSIKSAENDIL